MAYKKTILSLLYLFLAMTVEAVEYSVTNTASGTSGGVRFDNEIGSNYSLQILSQSTNFIWKIFQQYKDSDRKNVAKVSMFVESMDGVSYVSKDVIHLSADYIAGYSGNVRNEIIGILYHEMTHVWQWKGAGQAPGGLIEGVADYVRLKSGFIPSHDWVNPGQGPGVRWDEGYDVTARFLDYCNDLMDGFVAKLNGKMIDGYSQTYFDEILGKSVDQLWDDYKAKYA